MMLDGLRVVGGLVMGAECFGQDDLHGFTGKGVTCTGFTGKGLIVKG